jgi:hypothetical protein
MAGGWVKCVHVGMGADATTDIEGRGECTNVNGEMCLLTYTTWLLPKSC